MVLEGSTGLQLQQNSGITNYLTLKIKVKDIYDWAWLKFNDLMPHVDLQTHDRSVVCKFRVWEQMRLEWNSESFNVENYRQGHRQFGSM